MEDYEEFIQKQVRRIKTAENEESEQAVVVSQRPSDIRFYGSPVLPPLLYKDQKEELQRLREEAARRMNKRTSSSRVSSIQTILDSVQLRKAPTLDEFKDETGSTSSSCDPASNNESYGTLGSHWTSSSCLVFPSAQQTPEEKMLSHPLTSTALSHPPTSTALSHPLTSTALSHPPTSTALNHSPSSTAVSHPLTSTACDGRTSLNLRPLDGEDSLENSHTTVLFEGIPLVGNTSELNTDAQSPSQSHKHPQIDISHQVLSSGYVTIETSDVSSSWIEGVGIGAGARRSDFGGLLSGCTNSTGDIISHAPVDGDVLEEECTASSRAQSEIVELVNPAVEVDPAEGPYCMSLQNLLKKSQEHRRRQRMLRNQARQAAQADQHSLSDKENEDSCPADTGKNDLRRIRRRDQGKGQLIPSQVPTHRADKESVEDLEASKFDGSFIYRLSNTSATNSASTVTEKASPALSSHPETTASPPRPTSAASPPSAKSLYQSKSKKTGPALPKPCQATGKKFKNVPTPRFCLSPVRSKKGGAVSGVVRKHLVKIPVRLDDDAGPDPCSQDNSAVSVPAGTEGNVPVCRSTDQAEQITQLELNLSSLKLLISDLESTLSRSQGHFDPTEAAAVNDSSQQILLTDNESIGPPPADVKSPCVVTFSETAQQVAKDYGTRPGGKQLEPLHRVTSMVQKMRVPEAFRTISDSKRPSQRTTVLADASNHPAERKSASGERKSGSESLENSLNGSALNRSYDVDTPSRLWSQAGPNGIQLTPEQGGQEAASHAKRRLLMNTAETESGLQGGEGRPQSSTPKAASRWPELQLRREQEAQVKALVEEQCRHQQELLQSLATRYQFLRSMSFPCPSVGSRLEDVSTSPPPGSVSTGLGFSSQPSELRLAELSVLSDSLQISQSRSCLPVCYRPLVAAAAKGFLTRRLLHTERVAQLVRTIKDTQLFLKDLRSQTPGRELSSRQDQVLQERVALQLRSARYELHDLFFSLSPADRMQVISWDRELARQRELTRRGTQELQTGRRSSVTAATRKALERKRTVLLQKKAAERTKQPLNDSRTAASNSRRVLKNAPLSRRPR